MATTDLADRMVPPAPARPPDPRDTQSDAYLAWLRQLVWPDRVERVEGTLLVSSAPVPERQAALLDLGIWLREWAAGTGEVLPGTELRLQGEGLPRPVRGRHPDNCVPDLLLYRFANPRCLRVPSGPRGVPAGYVEGPPDLVVEVRSPGTEDYDLNEKRRAFARAGVPQRAPVLGAGLDDPRGPCLDPPGRRRRPGGDDRGLGRPELATGRGPG